LLPTTIRLRPSPPSIAGLDRRSINRKAVKNFAIVRDYLIDQKGRSLICGLNPSYIPDDPNRGRPYGVPDPRPQLKEFRGPSPFEENGGPGAWMDYGTGKQGPDVISLVMYIGTCDNKIATNWLRDLTDRLAEIKS
jgi:hypothetical protein